MAISRAKPVAAAVALACAASSDGARAAEGENVASVSLGFSGYTLADQNEAARGLLLGGEYERGVTDGLWLRAQGGVGGYPFGEWSVSADASVGITYAIDVLRYVPYVQGGVGALAVAGPGVERDLYPLLEAGAGVDILRSRSFSYGIQARVEAFFEGTAFFTAGARLSYRWGFF